ncbi:hypothetical protein LX32DRAFT_289713 [Colletotrichum zoysiae]|uniref:Uncharacterized protein n=1 Tax=Colletotrichum zoysiae TaxID=1216348 RepID=A0AAD9H3H8_9PEZI|nr:hypothetical protein LX32DRAFT_289713 [Colletotrichum zoysiae]
MGRQVRATHRDVYQEHCFRQQFRPVTECASFSYLRLKSDLLLLLLLLLLLTSPRLLFFPQSHHIVNILGLRSPVCEKIAQFVFVYEDVGYGARNNAEAVTDDAVASLATSCPKLKKVQLEATSHVADGGLLALFQNCPDLASVEVTGATRSVGDSLSGSALDGLREHPEWAPKLKKLILGETEHNKPFMKAMRALTKERPGLTVTLLQRSEVKKWGDWELEEWKTHYKKGRKVSTFFFLKVSRQSIITYLPSLGRCYCNGTSIRVLINGAVSRRTRDRPNVGDSICHVTKRHGCYVGSNKHSYIS